MAYAAYRGRRRGIAIKESQQPDETGGRFNLTSLILRESPWAPAENCTRLCLGEL